MSPPQVEGLSFSFDYFEIESEDRATSLSLGQLVALAAEGNLPAGTAVVRGASTADGGLGRLVRIDNVITNAALLDVEGWDVRAQYTNDFDFGAIDARFQYSHMDSYKFQSSIQNDPSEFMGEQGYPEDRINAELRLTRDMWTVNYSLNHISDRDGTDRLRQLHNHDLVAEFRTP